MNSIARKLNYIRHALKDAEKAGVIEHLVRSSEFLWNARDGKCLEIYWRFRLSVCPNVWDLVGVQAFVRVAKGKRASMRLNVDRVFPVGKPSRWKGNRALGALLNMLEV